MTVSVPADLGGSGPFLCCDSSEKQKRKDLRIAVSWGQGRRACGEPPSWRQLRAPRGRRETPRSSQVHQMHARTHTRMHFTRTRVPPLLVTCFFGLRPCSCPATERFRTSSCASVALLCLPVNIRWARETHTLQADARKDIRFLKDEVCL